LRLSSPSESFVQQSLSAARRTAVRASAWQGVAVVLLAAVFGLAAGRGHALAAGLGGVAVLIGSAVSAWFMVGGGVNPAGLVLGRWFVGLLAKWAVVLLALWVGLAVWRVPALPLLAGLVLALVVNVVAATRR
jgi:F0F1-type ATP synthase assembly protein I